MYLKYVRKNCLNRVFYMPMIYGRFPCIYKYLLYYFYGVLTIDY